MKKFLTTARKYEGMDETKDNIKLKALLNLDPKRVAWCAYFVKSILGKCNVGLKKANGLARSFLKEGEEVSLDTAKHGDVVVLKRGLLPWQGHVAFYVGHTKKEITLLGGNQSNMVREKKYDIKKVLSVRRIK